MDFEETIIEGDEKKENTISRKLIKNGNISFETNSLEDTKTNITQLVEKWVENSSFFFASKTDLDSLLMNEAKKVGLDTEKPFPFILDGKVSELQWHVINWNPKDSVHTNKKHQESGLNGVAKNENVRILGFYSNKHKAIFTHHSSNIHMHFTSKDQSLAGHVDGLKIKDSITLKLPKL